MAGAGEDALLDGLRETLELCLGQTRAIALALEYLEDREGSYLGCLERANLVQIQGIDSGAEPSVTTPCSGDPTVPNDACCAAVEPAIECSASGSALGAVCEELVDTIIFEAYECNPASQFLGITLFLGALILVTIGAIMLSRRTAFGPLLQKNFILWSKSWKSSICLQLAELSLVGVLAFVLVFFTDMDRVELEVPVFGRLPLILEAPDENRLLIYQNLRPFGGFFFLIVFTYPIATMVVSLVNEKETRMKEALRMAGMSDLALIVTWLITFLLTLMPLIVGAAVITHFGEIFPNHTVSETALFFSSFVLAMAGFSFLVAVFFTQTRPAAIASICVSFLIFFSSYHFLALPNKEDQLPGCLLPPVCLSLGVNTMLDDASLGTGFVRAASLAQDNRVDRLLTLRVCSQRLVLDAFLYCLVAWYLDHVVPQRYGVRRPLDFPIRPLYPYIRTAAVWLRYKGQVILAQRRGEEPPARPESLDSPPPLPFTKRTATTASAGSQPIDESQPASRHSGSQASGGTELESGIAMASVKHRIVIRDLVKEFSINGVKEKRVAVNNLNLSFERDKITVLLGPNGAGKSTTIAILTGLIEPTSGDVQVFGHSVRTDMQKIRGRLGWVPQHDILYPRLTVMQHLRLFCALRGKKLDMVSVTEMLREMAILDKLHAQARTLSGGQKRKLCLAMALVGDTEFILCDEVSSGVDPHSRRCIWNLLQSNRRGRAIILTTHFMDEADVLGDKIAIMANGSLCCEGTSLELKRQYGSGYRMVVVPNDRPNGQMADFAGQIDNVVTTEVPGASVASEGTSGIEYTLPFEGTPMFPTLLRRLQNELGCKVGISVSTLEEVFLRVAEEFAYHDTSLESLAEAEPYIEKYHPRRRAFFALLEKRFNYTKRDLRAFFFVIVLPIVFVCALLLMPNIQLYGLIFPGPGTSAPANPQCENNIPKGEFAWAFTNDNPVRYPILANRELDFDGRTCCPAVAESRSNTELAYFAQCIEVLPQCVAMPEDVAEARTRDCLMYRYWFCFGMPWICDATACCDPRNSQSPWYLCQEFANVDDGFTSDMLQFGGNQNNFCNEPGITRIQGYVNAFVRSLIVLLGFLFPTAYVIAFAVMETEEHRNTKDQQLMNGVSRFKYWASSYAFDQFILILPIIPVPFIIAGSVADTVNATREIIALITMLLLGFVIASVPMAYALSFSFRQHARALVGIIAFNIITGAALGTIVYVLQVVPLTIGDFTTEELVNDYIRNILSVFPAYAFVDGMLLLQTQLIDTCTDSDAISFLYCTDVVGEDETDLDQFEALSRVNRMSLDEIREIQPRFSVDNESSTQALLYMLGMTAVFWIYVAFRDTSFRRLLNCCRTDRTARRHRRMQVARPTGVDEPPVAIALAATDRLAPTALAAVTIDGEPMLSESFLLGEEAYIKAMRRQGDFAANMIASGQQDVDAEKARVQGNTSDIVQFLGLSKTYRKRKRALDDLWLGIEAGSCFGYLGVNGAGKSTTMRLLTGFETPTSGTATVLGHSIRTQLGQVRKNMGYCPQFEALFDKLTVREHLVLYSKVRGLSDVKSAVDMSIRRLQLEKFRNVQSYQLSGGNKRKLSAAIAMLGSPKLVVLDEPSSGVDPHAQRFLWNVIRDTTRRTGSAVILVSHSMPEVEACCDKIGVLISGRLRCLGTAQHLKNLYSSGYRVELTLKRDVEILAQPELVEHAEGLVTRDILHAVCEVLGMPHRAQDLSPTGRAASSPIAFALNTPMFGSVTWFEFSRWWMLEDAAERLEQHFKELWGQEEVDLLDRHENYLLFDIGDPALDIADMFEELERGKAEFDIEHYSISDNSLDDVFNRWVDEVGTGQEEL